ncbi:hypothetical protein LYSHEL_29120 [Lysobacter helvus]|uniref:DUF305 domain-containing protein n=2 Tax=Lysobacteraceae TaxID=32033 RepID=A0ABN6FY97_9GAMM|nr:MULTISPECIES: DUF305 domain-containing protein [Lysobacter]BCT93885.1 hypothetical protein LYSCAS_29090 [Lysobacter caseinilyticus]BCT97041.1 hypothetical protein LYSHEL_29120 [Lysobacter helvus]
MQHEHAAHGKQAKQQMHGGHYVRLLVMMGLSFLAMYALMYAMVDRLGNVYGSVNQAWMAGLMAAPMLVIELLVMWGMYPDKKRNALLVSIGVVAMIVFWALIRQQAAVTERQFLRSMIPHHAGAILMCEERKGRDGAEVQALCAEILASQRDEIRRMKALLGDENPRP